MLQHLSTLVPSNGNSATRSRAVLLRFDASLRWDLSFLRDREYIRTQPAAAAKRLAKHKKKLATKRRRAKFQQDQLHIPDGTVLHVDVSGRRKITIPLG